MSVSFTHNNQIQIDAPPEAVYDYVCDPNSWPEWLPASHAIESPRRALTKGEHFEEKWHIRRGEITMSWRVTESDRPNAWTVEAETTFIGRIVIRYTFEASAGGTTYTRSLINPARPSPPSAQQLVQIDEDARIGLANIKRIVEQRRGRTTAP